MIQRSAGEEPSLPIDDDDHHSIRALLPEYVMMLVLNQEPPAEWDAFRQHLARCLSCRDEAETLTSLMAESYAGPLPPTPVPVAPDLRFLHPGDALACDIVFSLTIRFTPALVERSLVAKRGPTRGNVYYEYTQRETQPMNLDLTIQVLTADEHATHGLLRIMVDQDTDNPMDQPPLRIIHRAGGVVREAITDPRGIASFEDVPLDDIADWEVSIAPIEG